MNVESAVLYFSYFCPLGPNYISYINDTTTFVQQTYCLSATSAVTIAVPDLNTRISPAHFQLCDSGPLDVFALDEVFFLSLDVCTQTFGSLPKSP